GRRRGRRHLGGGCLKVGGGGGRPRVARLLCVSFLCDYGQLPPDRLVALALLLDMEQFPVAFRSLAREPRPEVVESCSRAIDLPAVAPPAENDGEDEQQRKRKEKEVRDKGKANAAIILFRLKKSSDVVWNLLAHSSDPNVRSHLIHRLAAGALEGDAGRLQERLVKGGDTDERERSVRRALLLSLGEFAGDLPSDRRKELRALAWRLYGDA